jgi:hypothetical protein
MSASIASNRPSLRLVKGAPSAPVEWSWFCGHCATPPPGGDPPAPTARVCSACGLGLLLETRGDVVPGSRDPFLVVDSSLLAQALSRRAEILLGMREDSAVNRPVAELLVPADAETRSKAGFAIAIAEAAGGSDDPAHAFVRPSNTFGVRMRAKIAPCGPPRAALVVLEYVAARILRPAG